MNNFFCKDILKLTVFVSLFMFIISFNCNGKEKRVDCDHHKMALFMPQVDEFSKFSTTYATAAAEDLGIELISINTHNDVELIVKETKRLCKSGISGIIVHCDAIGGERILEITEAYEVPIFLINVDMQGVDFYPRTKYRSWIGQMLPDDKHAGASLAERLINEAQSAGEQNLHILAIEGATNADASINRTKGLKKYLQYLPNIETLTISAANWQPEKAALVFQNYYRLNPQLNIVWVANDSMAVAVAEKIKELGIKKKIYVGGINWDREAIKSIDKGMLQVSIGGHFLEATWGVILINDYLKGKDFASEGLSFITKMSAITSENSTQMNAFLNTPTCELNFKKLSKVTNANLTNYNFEFKHIVTAISKHKLIQPLELTKKEKEWIKNNPVIPIGIDQNWAPVEFIDKDKKLKGIAPDYLDFITKYTGLHFKYSNNMVWSETVQSLKNGKIWMCSAMVETPQRKSFAQFSTPYLSSPTIIVTNREVSYIQNMRSLKNKSVAIIKGYAIQDILELNYPHIILDEKESTMSALAAVSSGENFAFLGNLATVSYLMQKGGFTNLKISGKCPFSYDVTMAINRQYPELKSIVDKALKAITEEEKAKIYDKWMNVTYEHKTSFAVLWKTIAGAVVIIIAILLWTQKLNQLNKTLKEAKKIADKTKIMAENASKMKSHFLTNMSHEIRNPVNIISGFTDLLADRMTDKRNSKYIAGIKSAEKTLIKLTNNILDLSKIEVEKLKLKATDVNLKELFEDIKQIIIVKTDSKDLEAIVKIDKEIPTYSSIDKTRLKQILFNLINNAIKFTNSGYIQLSATKINTQTSGSYDLSITVKDTGIGITKSEQDKVFHIFEQQTEQETERYGGAGLGLAICKSLVEMMNGEITVESSLGLGSVFNVILHDIKIVEKTEVDEVIKITVDEPCSGMSLKSKVVLVVDDIPDNRTILREHLENFGATVIEAGDGEEAVHKSITVAVDLIIMDLRLPIMGGVEAAKLIKQKSTTPIIALSGAIEQEDIDTLSNSYFDAFLSKPVNKKKMFKYVCRFIGEPTSKKHSTQKTEYTPMKTIKRHDRPTIEIVEHLNNDIYPIWELIKISNSNSDISRFAKSINLLGEQFKEAPLIDFGTHLLLALSDHDDKKVNLFIDQFPKVLEYFENNAKSIN